MNEIRPIFPIPLGVASLAEGMAEKVVDAVYALQKKNGYNYDDNLAGRMITGEQVNLPHKHVTGVPEWDSICKSIIDFVTKETEIYVSNSMEAHQVPMDKYFKGGIRLKLVDIWSTIQKAGDYNPIHTHSGFCAGTMFVKVPEHITERAVVKEMEKGVFDINLDGSLNFVYGSSWRPENFCLNGSYRVSPEVGQAYFFPAWLNHVVYPYAGEEDRISVAWNFELDYEKMGF